MRFDPAIPSSFQGVLGTMDLTDRSDNLELLLSARDVSGSSSCALLPSPWRWPRRRPSRRSRCLPRSSLPDADGVLDTTEVGFYVDQDVSFTLTAETGNQSHTILQGQAPQGSGAELGWTLADGSQLADGDYPLQVHVTGACGMTREASTLVRLDTTAPVARIDFPARGTGAGWLLHRHRRGDGREHGPVRAGAR